MRVFRLLSARRLRQQPLRAAIAGVAVAAGVSLTVGIVVTSASVERSIEEFGRALAGPAPLRVVGPTVRGGLAEDAVRTAAATAGVRTVVPLVNAVTIADEPDGGAEHAVLALGVDCGIEELLGDVGCDPDRLATAGNEPIAIGPGLASGPTSLRTDGGRVELDPASLPVVDGLAALNGGRVVVFTIPGAQQRFREPGFIDAAYVVPDGSVSDGVLRTRLEAALGEHNAVLTATDPPPETGVILVTFIPLFGLLGIFGLGTGAVLVYNTMSLSLEERRRQLAVLGALGANRRTVIGGAVGEAVALGLVGGLVGVAGGIAVAGPIVTSLSSFTESVAGVPLELHVPVSAYVTGGVLGAAVAGLAAFLPARRATRIDVAAELSGRAVAADGRPVRLVRRALIWGSLSAAGAAGCWAAQLDGAIHPWQATVGPLAFLLTSVAAPITGSAVAPLLIGRLARATRRTRRTALLLAVADLVRDPRRAGIMAVALASPIIVGFGVDGFVSSARRGLERSFESSDGVSISTVEVNGGDDAFLSEEALARVAELPGVARLHRGVLVGVGSSVEDLLGVNAYEGTDLGGVRLVAGTADPGRLEAGEVLIGPGLARRTGARPGGTIELPTPGGTVDVPVQGITYDGNFGGFNVTMSYGQLTELYGRRAPSFVVVEPEPGVSEAQLAATLEEAAPSIDPKLRVLTTPELIAEITDAINAQMVPFQAMRLVLQIVAFVAVLSTLLLAGYQRRREHGLLAAVGARPPDLGRVVVAEAGITAASAIAWSVVMAPLVLWAMLQVLPILIGNSNPFDPDWLAFAGISAASLVIAVVASGWPAWRAGRVEVLDALRYE